MTFLMLLKILMFFLFSICESMFRKLPDRCETENPDCSFQFLHGEQNSCLIYNTSMCQNGNHDFTRPSLELSSELKAKFSVFVFPYSATLNKLKPLSAINITFTIQHKDVKGVSVTMRENVLNKTFCRILDFKNYSREIIIPKNLFYDCFYNIVEYPIQNVKMTFKSFPMNEELSYYVYIPPAMNNGSRCSWQALVMVFCGTLSKGIVMVKFSPAPKHLNITSYAVKLIQVTSNETQETRHISSFTQEDMICEEFSSIVEGYYYVSVIPNHMNGIHCPQAQTIPFHVGYSQSFVELLILLICIIVLLSLSFFLIGRCVITKMNTEFLPKQILLVHSDDCPEHGVFISLFSSYLTNMCKVNVSTIYGKVQDIKRWIKDINSEVNTKDPQQWLKDKYKEADAIIFVISEGLSIALGKDKTIQLKENNPWRQQLSNAITYISFQMFNSGKTSMKKFCKVCFPYSHKGHIPHCIDDLGRCYMLPKEFNQLLCFIFDCAPIIPCTNLYPKLQGSNLNASDLGIEMLVSIKTIQTAVDNKTNIKIQKTANLLKNSRVHKNACSTSFTNSSSFKSLTQYEAVQNKDSEICDEVNNVDSEICDEVNNVDSENYNEKEIKSEQCDSRVSDSDMKDWESYLVEVNNQCKSSSSNHYLKSCIEKEFS